MNFPKLKKPVWKLRKIKLISNRTLITLQNVRVL